MGTSPPLPTAVGHIIAGIEFEFERISSERPEWDVREGDKREHQNQTN